MAETKSQAAARRNRNRADRKRKELAREERRYTVSQLLMSHYSYRDMGEALGVSVGTIASDVKAVRKLWEEKTVHKVDVYLTQEVETLNNDERELRELMRQANIDRRLRIYDRILRIRERRAALLGLNAPAYLRMLASHDGPVGGEGILMVGGSEDQFVDALEVATGLKPPGRLKAVN